MLMSRLPFFQFSCLLKLNFTFPPILNSTNFEVEEKMSERQFFEVNQTSISRDLASDELTFNHRDMNKRDLFYRDNCKNFSYELYEIFQRVEKSCM